MVEGMNGGNTVATGAPAPSEAGGIGLPEGVVVANPWIRLGAYVVESILMVVTLFFGWLIWAALVAPTGQTPAKKLMKLRVIGADTIRPVGFGKMFFMRGLVAGVVAGFALLFTLGILALMPFWDKRKQNIWDKVSGTYVVQDSDDAWGMHPDLRV